MEIRIPRLGEGVNSGTVVNVLVSEGETVKKDQTVLELETEKAVAPIPSPEAGTITKIMVKAGDSVPIGQLAMILEAGAGSAPSAVPAAAPSKPSSEVRQAAASAVQAPAYQPSGPHFYESKSGFAPPASPTVRKMAKDLGIDLARVRGTESGGRISLTDLRDYVQQIQQMAFQQPPAAPAAAPAKPVPESIDFSKWGPVTKKPFSNLRKTIAKKLTDSWNAIPLVTQFDEADITGLLELRKKYVPAYEKKGAKLTVTGFILKALVATLKKHPIFNTSLDEATGELVYKNYYHLGVAVDTESGLIVPVLRDVDKKSLSDLSIELHALAEKTRQRKVGVDDLQGGTFNLSNLGSIGGTFFTPLVTKPQVAVLGVGRGVLKPIVKDKKVEVGNMLPLGLSYDHNVIDGADGARFIKDLVTALENFDESVVKI